MSLISLPEYQQSLPSKKKVLLMETISLKQHKIAVIGGGRWGRIITNVLAGFQNVSKIYLISNRNSESTTCWLEEISQKNKSLGEKIVVDKNLDTVIEDKSVEVAFVANYPAEHYDTTKALLMADKHVMVEKPFVPHVRQAFELVNLAREKKLVLAVDLELMWSSYFYHFRNLIKKYESEPKQVKFFWHDVFQEQRHGVLKLPDMSINVFKDIFPHILTILHVLFNERQVLIEHISIEDGGDSAVINLNYGGLPVSVSLSRTGDLPCRTIEVVDQDQRIFFLDFTKEPGQIWLDGEKLPEDSDWMNLPGTLNMEFDYFLHEIQEQRHELPCLAEKTIGIVETVEQGNMIINKEQINLISNFLFNPDPEKPGREILVALREHLLLEFLKESLVKSPKDEAQVNFWTEKALSLIHKFSYNPFTTQRECLKELNITKEELIKLNAIIRNSSFSQLLILEHGYGVKYWKNTIIPLIQSGVVNASIDNGYNYPHRVGVYLGRSCMFFCSFCGRNPTAKYESSVLGPGNELLKQMFQDAPKDDPYKFYISGGLEPLTNQGVGELVKFGAEQGFKLSMYTNGYLLTPDMLRRQPGLWDLDTLRISLYGVNEESAAKVTGNKNSFSRIIKNAKDFLRLRDENKTSVKFGFNFVILPDCAEHVLELAEVIAEINTESGAMRQIDFLTLREDYSYAEDERSKFEKQENLIEVFEKLEKRRQRPDLSDLYIDYGYGLYGASLGKLSPSLYMVKSEEIRPKGYPQISVVIDLLGDVYQYREAGFLDRPGAHRYILGRASESQSVPSVIREFVESGKVFSPQLGDTGFFDAFDHLVTGLVNQAEDDREFGIPFEKGPVKDRIYVKEKVHNVTVAHPTLAPSSLPPLTGEPN